MRVTTSQYEKSGKNHICSVKTFSSRAWSNRPRKKNSLEQAAFWHEVKVVCCLLTPLFTLSRSSHKTAVKKVSIWVFFTCNKYCLQATDDKSNGSSVREGIPLDALQKLYELHTPKSFGHEGSKAWALSVVPHFSLSLLSLVFLAWCAFHACLRFAHCTIPEEKWGLLVVYDIHKEKKSSNINVWYWLSYDL